MGLTNAGSSSAEKLCKQCVLGLSLFSLSWLMSTQCVHLSVVQRLCALFWSNPLKSMCDTLQHFFLHSQPTPFTFFFLQPSTLQTLTVILSLGSAHTVFSFNVGASLREHVAGPAANLFTLASTLRKSCAHDRVRDTSPWTKLPQATFVCFFTPSASCPTSRAKRKPNTASTNFSVTPH